MSQLWGGYPLTVFTQLCLILYCYGVLWAYAAVFSSSVDTLFFQYVMGQECNIYLPDQITGCYVGYYVCVAGFSLVVLYLSFQDISEQAKLQQVLTIYRFAAFGVMGITVFIAAYYPNPFSSSSSSTFPHFTNDVPLVDFSGFGMIFSTAGVALNVHYNLPDIVQPLKASSRKSIMKVCISAMCTTLCFYIVLGWLCAEEFGAHTFPLVTLNWSSYTGVGGGWAHGTPTIIAIFVKLFIMLFPVINMLSVFPLVAISLADNLITSLPAHYRIERPHSVKTWSRILAVVPPLIFTILGGKLDVIFNATGLVAFFLELVIPCLFQLLSLRYMSQHWGADASNTPFTHRVFSSQPITIVVLVLSLVSFVYATYVTIQSMITGEAMPI